MYAPWVKFCNAIISTVFELGYKKQGPDSIGLKKRGPQKLGPNVIRPWQITWWRGFFLMFFNYICIILFMYTCMSVCVHACMQTWVPALPGDITLLTAVMGFLESVFEDHL